MKRDCLIVTVASSLILAVLLFLSGCLSADPRAEREMAHGMMLGVESEFDFLVEMIPHHQEAVDTASETAVRTNRLELRDFAQKNSPRPEWGNPHDERLAG